MASYSVHSSKHATLSTTTVDTVTLGQRGLRGFDVLNRGSNALSFRWAVGVSDVAAPTDLGDDCEVAPAGCVCSVTLPRPSDADVTIKIIGNGDAYSVLGW